MGTGCAGIDDADGSDGVDEDGCEACDGFLWVSEEGDCCGVALRLRDERGSGPRVGAMGSDGFVVVVCCCVMEEGDGGMDGTMWGVVVCACNGGDMCEQEKQGDDEEQSCLHEECWCGSGGAM